MTSAPEIVWAQQILGAPVTATTSVGIGRNAHVLRLQTADARLFALKSYPRHAHDEVDRYQREREALRWLEVVVPGRTPRWLAGSSELRVALMSWLDGMPPTTPGAGMLEQILDFVGAIFAASAAESRQRFGPASAACSSGPALERQIAERYARLRQAGLPALTGFLHDRLPPVWQAALAFRHVHDPLADAALSSDAQRLVAADLGLHNSLQAADGRLRFVDFEYFGWDDPIRFLADFVLHPGQQLAAADVAAASERFFSLPEVDADGPQRFHARLPLFALRWSLIVLNPLLPDRRPRQPVDAGRQIALAKGLVDRAGQLMKESCHA